MSQEDESKRFASGEPEDGEDVEGHVHKSMHKSENIEPEGGDDDDVEGHVHKSMHKSETTGPDDDDEVHAHIHKS